MITPPPECRVSGPENTTITCHPGETLLDAWLRQGVAARFSCRGGSCHTCMLRCVAGELPDRAQQGIPLRLQEKGYFLPCLCVPTGPLEVAPVVPDDFITDCVVESQKRIPVGWLVCLEPITAYPAEPGQYTCLRLASPADAETQLPWITPWRVENRQEEDFYLHLVFAFPADATPPPALATLAPGTTVQLRPARTQAERQSTPTADDRTAPDLWTELRDGTIVREALEDFYNRVYADARLAPFFRGVTKERLVGKQYAFLHDEMHGGRSAYFGDNMRNTHHWMVIPDDLFDHRQRLMGNVLRDHGLTETQIALWMHFEERHRHDIVKDAPWERMFGNQPMPADGHERETLSCGAMCDHCGREIQPGESVLYHVRLGSISCSHCQTSTSKP